MSPGCSTVGSGDDRPRDGSQGEHTDGLHGTTHADDRAENSGAEWVGDGEVDERNAAAALREFDRGEIGERGCESGGEWVSVSHRLGTAPIGNGVEKMNDAVAELHEAHHDGGYRGHGTGNGAFARATKPVPDHLAILAGWRHVI